MSASDAIQSSFKKLVLRMPYEKISVAEICREAHVSRKTFYANFTDKENVVSRIFIEGAVEPMRTMNAMLTLSQARSISTMYTENLYSYFLNESNYYKKLVGPMFGTDDTFIRVVTRALHAFNKEILDAHSSAADIEKEYMAYFFASSQAMFCQKWIADGMPITPRRLTEIYSNMAGAFWFDVGDGHVK